MTDPAPCKTIAVIPARWASSRFPGKPLHLIAGKPLLQHVWERCQECRLLAYAVVATDDPRIAEAARGFGAEVAMTRSDHPSGTDRVAEAARLVGDPEVTHILNVQGDEPLIEPALIDRLAQRLGDDPTLHMITAANVSEDRGELANPHVVKVVTTSDGDALYFSRSPLPHGAESFLRHKGIYGFRRDFLFQFVSWPPSPLERAERLEQLRALEHGARIHVVVTPHRSIGVDTPEQVAIVEAQLSARPPSPPSPPSTPRSRSSSP